MLKMPKALGLTLYLYSFCINIVLVSFTKAAETLAQYLRELVGMIKSTQSKR